MRGLGDVEFERGSPGTISAAGLYTAPAGITTLRAISLVATSQADAAKFNSVSLILLPPVGVSVAPGAVSLFTSQTQQFTASVSNAVSAAVTWTVSPVNAGTVSVGGLYTAPASITVQQTVVVTATSVADSSKFSQTLITLSPGQGTAVSG